MVIKIKHEELKIKRTFLPVSAFLKGILKNSVSNSANNVATEMKTPDLY